MFVPMKGLVDGSENIVCTWTGCHCGIAVCFLNILRMINIFIPGQKRTLTLGRGETLTMQRRHGIEHHLRWSHSHYGTY